MKAESNKFDCAQEALGICGRSKDCARSGKAESLTDFKDEVVIAEQDTLLQNAEKQPLTAQANKKSLTHTERTVELNELTLTELKGNYDLEKLQREDSDLKLMIEFLEEGKLPVDEKESRRIVAQSDYYFINEENILCRLMHTPKKLQKIQLQYETVVIPQILQEEIVEKTHENLCHAGIDKTFQVIKQKFYFANLYVKIKKFVLQCEKCQMMKRNYGKQTLPLRLFPPSQALKNFHLDILQLPKSKSTGLELVAVFTDRLTSWVECIPIVNQDAETMTELVMQLCARFGCITSLYTDRAAAFLSNIFQNFLKAMNIKHCTTSTTRPQSDGHCERRNQSIIQSIRLALENSEDFITVINQVLWGLRASPTVGSFISPYTLTYGIEATLPVEIEIKSMGKMSTTVTEYFENLIPKIKQLREIAQENIEQAEKQYKFHYDKRNRVQEVKNFQIGEKVWLRRLQVPSNSLRKIVSKFTGVYEIDSHVHDEGSHVYMLKSVKTGKIYPHPVNFEHLRRYIPRDPLLFAKNNLFSNNSKRKENGSLGGESDFEDEEETEFEVEEDEEKEENEGRGRR